MRVLGASLLLAALWVTPGHGAGPPRVGFDASRAGTTIADVPFTDATGKAFSLADFRGKRLLVVLWASWCAACVAELPDLARLETTHGGDDFAVLTIARETAGSARRVLQRQGLSELPAFADPDGRLGDALAQEWLPTAILVDAQGREVVRAVGSVDWDKVIGEPR